MPSHKDPRAYGLSVEFDRHKVNAQIAKFIDDEIKRATLRILVRTQLMTDSVKLGLTEFNMDEGDVALDLEALANERADLLEDDNG